jgi:hypothetical protein
MKAFGMHNLRSRFAFPISYCIAPGNYSKRFKNWLQSGTQDSVQQPANSFSTPIKPINMSHSALNGTLMAAPIKTN